MLAHELSNPLASVSNAIQILRMANVPAEHAEGSKEVIERQVKHLARFLDDLLDVSRITRGVIELRKERIEASPIVNSAVDAVRLLIEEKKQELAVSYAPGTLWCKVDPTRLEQVLINLLTNATRYTQVGGHIRMTARNEGGHVTFRVQDDGIGPHWLLTGEGPQLGEVPRVIIANPRAVQVNRRSDTSDPTDRSDPPG